MSAIRAPYQVRGRAFLMPAAERIITNKDFARAERPHTIYSDPESQTGPVRRSRRTTTLDDTAHTLMSQLRVKSRLEAIAERQRQARNSWAIPAPDPRLYDIALRQGRYRPSTGPSSAPILAVDAPRRYADVNDPSTSNSTSDALLMPGDINSPMRSFGDGSTPITDVTDAALFSIVSPEVAGYCAKSLQFIGELFTSPFTAAQDFVARNCAERSRSNTPLISSASVAVPVTIDPEAYDAEWYDEVKRQSLRQTQLDDGSDGSQDIDMEDDIIDRTVGKGKDRDRGGSMGEEVGRNEESKPEEPQLVDDIQPQPFEEDIRDKYDVSCAIAQLCDSVQGLMETIRVDRLLLRQQLDDSFQRAAELVQQHLPRHQDPGDDVGPQSRRKRGQPKVTTNPKRRSADSTFLAAQVRKFFVELVGGEEHLLQERVSQEEAENFAILWEATKGVGIPDCCDERNFRYDLLGTPRSPWNRSAARVFTRAFNTWAELDFDTDVLEEAFFTWLKSLKQARKKSQLSRTERQIAVSMSRRKTRRRTLFHIRLDTAQGHPLLQRHVPMLERLGPEGMSDDESDVEDGHDEARPRPRRPVYRVKYPCWRAAEVGEWLEVFDVVHLYERRAKPDLRGQYPRIRARVPRVVDNEAKPVQQLPVNTYDATWLESQINPNHRLRPLADRYDFRHENGLFSLVRVLVVIVVRLAKAGVRAYCIVRVLWKKHIYVTKEYPSAIFYNTCTKQVQLVPLRPSRYCQTGLRAMRLNEIDAAPYISGPANDGNILRNRFNFFFRPFPPTTEIGSLVPLDPREEGYSRESYTQHVPRPKSHVGFTLLFEPGEVSYGSNYLMADRMTGFRSWSGSVLVIKTKGPVLEKPATPWSGKACVESANEADIPLVDHCILKLLEFRPDAQNDDDETVNFAM
ncbi:hypothetical protein EYR36_003017 [Pleurotus pulmonarius]|nr:hypothetical protein EYR36_003017 [Pleurotus pulmonarius]